MKLSQDKYIVNRKLLTFLECSGTRSDKPCIKFPHCTAGLTLKTRNPIIGTFAKSEDPDEMLHNAAFHQDLHCLQRQNLSSENEIQIFGANDNL